MPWPASAPALGGAFLYRGLAAGRMGVVAPVSAVGAAILPVAVGVTTGERPELLVWLGIAAAVPGIWLVSREPGGDGSLAAGLVDGVLAALGFGLLFAAIGQVPDGAGYWPLALAQVTSLLGRGGHGDGAQGTLATHRAAPRSPAGCSPACSPAPPRSASCSPPSPAC